MSQNWPCIKSKNQLTMQCLKCDVETGGLVDSMARETF